MRQTYFYTLFGQRVASELALPEAAPWPGGSEAQADIRVVRGILPPQLRQSSQNKNEGAWIHAVGDGDFWFESPGGAYYISGGERILFEPAAPFDETTTRVFLLGSAFGLVLIQRGLVPMHGSAVLRGGRAVIIGGQSGAGKSTITSRLVERHGVDFLTDDVAVLELREDGIWVLPAYPQRKLCRDAALALDYQPSELVEISAEREKYAVRSARGWCDKPVRLGALVEILPDDTSGGVSLELVRGHASLGLVIRNLYRNFVHFLQGMKPEQMKKCVTIAAQAPFYLLRRPLGGQSVEEVTETILTLL